jgi:hypothetical protein
VLAPRPSTGAGAPDAPGPIVPGGVGAVLGLPAGAVAALVAWAFGGAPVAGVVLAAAAAATLAAVTTPLGALGAAALCWACADGFVLHRFGTLGDGRADLLALAAVAAAAAVAYLVGATVRHVRAARLARGYAARDIPVPLPRVGTVIRQP